jgi:hypothetical protein
MNITSKIYRRPLNQSPLHQLLHTVLQGQYFEIIQSHIMLYAMLHFIIVHTYKLVNAIK